MMRHPLRRGFSLIELLVVIVIIALLIALMASISSVASTICVLPARQRTPVMRATSARESLTHSLARNSPKPRYQASCTSSPPSAAVSLNISAWIWQARSQVGSRLAVASIATQ